MKQPLVRNELLYSLDDLQTYMGKVLTTGLDAFSSFEVVKPLTKLAKSSQNTITISIYQPRSGFSSWC
jgi:hypothetical protein